ncbi:MAG: biotin transporter BioY [Chloroflexi bacterium]|nr:biotin transporter BioY [Chloroflexota bacterium]
MQAEARYATFAEAIAPPKGLMRYAVLAALVAGGSALTALCAQFRVQLPFTPVPITGQTFAALLVGALLGSRLGAAALTLYMMEGSAGLLWGSKAAGFKVFAGGANGWETIAGPTGGYIVGFIAAAFVVGWLAERGFDRRPWSLAFAMALGNVIIYVFGLPWLDHFRPGIVQTFSLPPDTGALDLGLYPFIAGDAAKLLLAASLVPVGRAALARVPGVEEAVPRAREGPALGPYVPPLYAILSGLIILGSLLPWGLAGGGDDIGISQRSGQVAFAAGLASLVLLAQPRLALWLICLALIVVGSLLPFGVLPDTYNLAVDQEAGLIALGATLAAVAAIAVLAVPRFSGREAMRTGQFLVGALAGFASFWHIVQLLTAAEHFTPTDLRAGLFLAALASVLLAATAIVDRPEETAG